MLGRKYSRCFKYLHLWRSASHNTPSSCWEWTSRVLAHLHSGVEFGLIFSRCLPRRLESKEPHSSSLSCRLQFQTKLKQAPLQFTFGENNANSGHKFHPELEVFTMPRSALFVIDIQRELAQDPKTRIPHADRICSAGEKILSAARDIVDQYQTARKQSPSVIVFVQHEEKPDEGTLVRDTEPWRLVFEPRDGIQEERLVAKTTR